MGVELVYQDIPPGIKENLTSFTVGYIASAYSSVSLTRLQQYDPTQLHIITLEDNYWKLDGTFVANDKAHDTLIWSRYASNSLGEISDPPELTRVWSDYYTSTGIYFVFHGPDYCNNLTITWYQDNTVLLTKTFYPNSTKYFCRQNVSLFNKITVQFNNMSNTCRFLKLADIIDGRVMIFNNSDIESINVLEELKVEPSDDAVPVNTVNVSILQNKDDDIDFIFQTRQNVNLMFNDNLYGTYFIENDGKRTGKYKFELSLIDYKGLLDTAPFKGGRYVNATAQSIIDEIMYGENIPYTIDEVTATQRLTGILPICTKRQALSDVLTGCCSVCDDSRSDTLRIFKLDKTDTASKDEEKVFIGTGKLASDAPITAVSVTVHDFVKSTSKETVFEGTLEAGTHVVEFSSPIDTVGATITGGTLTAYTNVGVVVCSSTSTVKIEAYTYTDNTVLRTLENPVVRVGTPTNEKTISNCPFISASNADAVLANMLQCYKGAQTFTSKMLIEGMPLGKYLTSTTDWEGETTGFVQKLEYSLYNKHIGTVTQHTYG